MLKTYGVLAGHQAVAVVLSVLMLVLVPLALPTETFGRFSLIFSVAQVITIVALSWPNAGLLRYAREEYRERGTIGGALGARLGLHAVLLVVVLPLAWLFSGSLENLFGIPAVSIWFLLAAFVVLSFNEMGQYAAQAVEKFAGYGLSPVVMRLAQVVTLAGFVAGWAGGWPVLMAGTLIGYGLGGALVWAQIPRRAFAGLGFDRAALGRILRYSWAVPIGAAGAATVTWMDLWFLHHLIDDETVGVYAWAYNVSLLASAFLIPLAAVIAPRMIDLKVKADAPATARYTRAAGAAYFLWVALVPAMFVPVLVISAVIGFGAFAAALYPVMILLAATAFQLASYLINPVLVTDPRLVPATVAVSLGVAAINAAGNILLIPVFGISGPALASAAAFAFGMAAPVWFLRRYTDAVFPGFVKVTGFGAVGVAAVALPLWAGPGAGAVLCTVATAVLVISAKRFGLFRGAGGFAPLAADLPRTLRAPAGTVVRWLDGGGASASSGPRKVSL